MFSSLARLHRGPGALRVALVKLDARRMSVSPVKKEHTRLLIGAGFLTVFSLMLIVTWLSVATLQSVNEDMATLVRDTTRKTARAFDMRDAIRQRSAAIRSLETVTDQKDTERLFSTIGEMTANYDRARQELGSFGGNAREIAVISDTGKIDARVAAAYTKVNNLFFSLRADPAALRTAIGELRLQEYVLLNHLNTLVDLERTLAEESLSASQDKYDDTRRLLLVIVVAAFATSLAISAIVIARVSRTSRRIAHLASHDDLTGLHNRRSFEQRLAEQIKDAQLGERTHGLLYLDLDRFKIVNDTCGHQAGDQLLIDLTSHLEGQLRGEDVFARVGGDEFAIVAQERSIDCIARLAENLRALVDDFAFEYASQVFRVSLSIGVVLIDDRVENMQTVLADVDSACYVAKQSGRNRVHISSGNDQEVVKYRSDIAGVRSIREALAEERLTLFFQPVFGIEEEGVSMAHCEVLLRIRSETGEMFSPARFIPIAEKYNIMSEIDQWVFSRVADWIAAHQETHLIPRLLVNLSGLSFTDESFSDFVVNRLERGDVDTSKIAFEITETAAVDNLDKARVFVNRVRGLGCRFALDDFGSGFSTFAYLKNMPIDYLKIDGSLVVNLVNDEVDREMVRAINDIGHTVGALTVAEFVEDDETLERLRRMGVDYAQGYGLRMPSPLGNLIDELTTRGKEGCDESEGDIRQAS